MNGHNRWAFNKQQEGALVWVAMLLAEASYLITTVFGIEMLNTVFKSIN
jgi:hypothetical protein